jgi:hypothetical protein
MITSLFDELVATGVRKPPLGEVLWARDVRGIASFRYCVLGLFDFPLQRSSLENGTSVVMSHGSSYLGVRNDANHSRFAAVHVHLRKQSSAGRNSSTLLIIKHLPRLSSGARGLIVLISLLANP